MPTLHTGLFCGLVIIFICGLLLVSDDKASDKVQLILHLPQKDFTFNKLVVTTVWTADFTQNLLIAGSYKAKLSRV